MPINEVLKRLRLSKKDLELAQKYGGFCKSDWEGDDQRFLNLGYCDKSGHRERSIGNNPKIKRFQKEKVNYL